MYAISIYIGVVSFRSRLHGMSKLVCTQYMFAGGTLIGTEVGMRCFEMQHPVPLGCCHD